MQRTIRRDAATLGLEGAPAYPPPSRESTTISSTFSREATIPRSSTFLREATGSRVPISIRIPNYLLSASVSSVFQYVG